jgi:hypothetical protein
MQDKWLLKTGSAASVKQTVENVRSRFLFKLTLFSTFVFVFAVLILRFLLNLQTAALLRIYSIHFQYRLFDIQSSTVDGTKWPVARILLVFGLGYLVFTFAGIWLVYALRRIHNVNWKTRLFLTWMAFLLTSALPAGIIAGIFSFNCFGIAFQWLVWNIIVRIIIGTGVLVMMIISRPLWVFLFLKASPSSIYFADNEHQKVYIRNVLLKAWFAGSIILLVFNKPMFDGFWPVFLVSLGFSIIPLFNRPVLYNNLYIRKSEKKVFSSRYSLLFILIILTLIWVAGNYRINF